MPRGRFVCECSGCLDGEDCYGGLWPRSPHGRPPLRPGARVFVCVVCGATYNRPKLPSGHYGSGRVTCSAICLAVRQRRLAVGWHAERAALCPLCRRRSSARQPCACGRRRSKIARLEVRDTSDGPVRTVRPSNSTSYARRHDVRRDARQAS